MRKIAEEFSMRYKEMEEEHEEARHFRAQAGQRFLFSGALVSMGNGLRGDLQDI